MSITFEQAEKVKKFLLKTLGITYACIGLSRVGMYDKKVSAGKKKDWCVSVRLYATAPAGVVIPKEKDSVRIFVKKNYGMPRAQGKPSKPMKP